MPNRAQLRSSVTNVCTMKRHSCSWLVQCWCGYFLTKHRAPASAPIVPSGPFVAQGCQHRRLCCGDKVKVVIRQWQSWSRRWFASPWFYLEKLILGDSMPHVPVNYWFLFLAVYFNTFRWKVVPRAASNKIYPSSSTNLRKPITKCLWLFLDTHPTCHTGSLIKRGKFYQLRQTKLPTASMQVCSIRFVAFLIASIYDINNNNRRGLNTKINTIRSC
jgi:hypothetical protein